MKPERAGIAPSETTLVIDGSGTSVFAGLLGEGGQWIAQENNKVTPLEGLFPVVESVLSAADCKLQKVRNFVYCEGPGSILGLRLCAMAMQTWGHLAKPPANYFSYNSLELTVALLILDKVDLEHALLISDWKKDVWHAIEINNGQPSAITTVDDQTVQGLDKGPLYYLPQRKGWQSTPPSAITLEYSPQRLPEVMQLLKMTQKIELYASNLNTFKKWVPQRHRATH